MAAKKEDKWMEKAFSNSHGQLRAKAGAKKGKPIPEGKLDKMTHSKSVKTRKQANLAEIARKSHKK